MLLVGVAYSLIAIVVFALPLLLVFSRLRVINVVPSLVAGFLIGAIVAGLTERPAGGLIQVIRLDFGDHAVLRIWFFSAIGCVSGLGFWFVRARSSTSRVE